VSQKSWAPTAPAPTSSCIITIRIKNNGERDNYNGKDGGKVGDGPDGQGHDTEVTNVVLVDEEAGDKDDKEDDEGNIDRCVPPEGLACD